MHNIHYRKPSSLDGPDIHNLIRRCPPLDQNSLYCNLLQCTDFAETCIVAESDNGEVAGFISGYIKPHAPNTLFIWQVALDEKYRGLGIASTMLSELFNRNSTVTHMETTISPSNHASQKLFETFFKNHHMPVETRVLFESGRHLDSEHEDEVLYSAGPAKQLRPIKAHSQSGAHLR
ncbi:diaminobutyrate acetyltransferase [Neptunomonas marina]|uniref:L-2,4-diaminobutyric acid acetyltransferase n=1 Tax=Neptunomonas marina TaxID=1815562 RepID=A0A437QEI6_9GAMM|nr:diaminobutyrate acetyltransferase [Neptunomonas marina]RVU32849.1 diaminobutyrate acetyltransferase [Neptunomonas marina]